jgi:signal transduction histidine kinase/ActR/RegA family two-component response regulator
MMFSVPQKLLAEPLGEAEPSERLYAMLAALRECATGNTDSRLPPIGGPLGLLVNEFNRVLDARTEIEAQLRIRNAALEASQRQLERQAVELEAARQSAEQASRSKSSFLANMSHEIRTPMTSILGFTELLLNDDSPGSFFDRRAALDTIQRNGRHLLELINGILDVAKIEADCIEIEQIPCSLSGIIGDVVSLMSPRAFEKRLELRVVNATAVPECIVTDPLRVKQILINLASNAIKFTHHGEVRIEVSATRLADQHVRLSLSVVDTGIGLDAAQIGRLFQPFAQADAATSRKYGGSGLGLSISRSLAQLLGGDVEVESTPGQGSTFRASLIVEAVGFEGCRLQEVSACCEGVELATVKCGARLPTLPPCRILLAEDGRDNRRLISYLLEQAGAEVLLAIDGREAVELGLGNLTKGPRVDLVLVDLQMPEVDGLDATRQLRAAGFDRPIFALTANAMEGTREKCLAAGCNAYLPKPLETAAFLDTIRTWLTPAAKLPLHPMEPAVPL